MALSNKLGLLVLATGNKSEISVGYSTLYGDMVGGFAPSATSPRPGSTGLARWRNASEGREVIPQATIARPPTAELRPGQLDTDSLPPYDVLDAILEGYVEQGLEPDDLVRRATPSSSSPRSSGWWIAPSTSDVRGRWESRSPRARSGAIAECRSRLGMSGARTPRGGRGGRAGARRRGAPSLAAAEVASRPPGRASSACW